MATARGKNSKSTRQAPLRLWLIRHAHALDAVEGADAARPLSQRGRRQIRLLARLLGAREIFQPTEVWHSPLVRSQQTAELLARRLALDARSIQLTDIKPDDAPHAVARRIKRVRHSVAIVGHEPHLSALASLLVAGRATPVRFVLKKCAALALERAGGRWVVRWLVSPEVLP